MALKVVVLTNHRLARYRRVAEAMSAGIQRCGDKPVVCEVRSTLPAADVGVTWGWRQTSQLRRYRHFVYADFGYWSRDSYYRVSVDSWGPERYVRAGLPRSRFDALGLQVRPWRSEGAEILIVGCSAKSAADHGFAHLGWETKAAEALKDCGFRVVYRPKPTEKFKRRIRGVGYDERPIAEALAAARAVVTHHSNTAVEALLGGIPVHCELGPAACMSVPLNELTRAAEPEGREQFLTDVAWLQWTADEIRKGDCWAHLKAQGLLC